MTIRFNADEVFQMAERAEETAGTYYREAAAAHTDKANTDFLTKMADMEDAHKTIFSSLRKELAPAMTEETAFDPFLEATLYLDEMAAGHGGEGSRDAKQALAEASSLEDIVRVAIGMEQKAIIFYLGLKDLVPDSLGKDKIDEIISEEKSHIITLAGELRALTT